MTAAVGAGAEAPALHPSVRRPRLGRPRLNDKVVLPDYTEGIQIKTEDPDPRFSNALARGLALLRAFQVDRKLLGNLELAELTGLSKPTVSRLAYTLTQLGYLRYREEFGKYELAAGVMGLAYPYVVNQPVPAIARPLMLELARETRTNVGLGIQEDLTVLYLEYSLGEEHPNRLQRAGFRVPLVRTAMGRACVAGLHPVRREKLYQHLSAYYGGREWPALRKELDGAVEQVQAHGYCIAAGTFNPTTNSVAVPLPMDDGTTMLSLNSQGHATRQTPAVMARNGRKLVALAQEIRRQLAGGRFAATDT